MRRLVAGSFQWCHHNAAVNRRCNCVTNACLRFAGLTCSCIWVPEGSLAGFFVRHEMALELVCGADFSCKLNCRASPGDLEGSWGQVWPKIPGNPTRKFPARLPSGTQLNHRYGSNRSPDPPIWDFPDLHNTGGFSCCFWGRSAPPKNSN